jgi:hypothetical protein
MRTYYSIYIYYGTYDITWYAFYAWIWTALEANLGVICASAPALKVFFRRYFNVPTNLHGNSGTAGNNGWWKRTGNAHQDMGRNADVVPLDCIKIGSRPHVTIECGDETMSQASDTSTKNLTALPSTPSAGNQSSRRGG